MLITAPTDMTASGADWARPLYARQIAALGELAEAGLRIALEVEQQLKADDTASRPAPEAAIAGFARISRAVRLSFLLQSKLIKALEERDRHGGYLVQCARTDKTAQVSRIVSRIAQRQDLDEDDIDRLVDETRERLDHDDIYGAVLTRPTSELVAAVCKDLGLAIDWPALSEEAWLQDEMAPPPLGERILKRPAPSLTRLRPRDAPPERERETANARPRPP